MIIKPDYNKLLEKAGSKYRLCVVASKRAEQLIENNVRMREGKPMPYEGPLVEDVINRSPLYIALKEIEEGKITFELPEEEQVTAPAEEEAQDIDVSLENLLNLEDKEEDSSGTSKEDGE